MTLVCTLVIRRGSVTDAPSWSRFEVTFEPGESILDALRQLRIDRDPTLAFRYSCINANACKECLILVDGDVAYACTARLEPREMRLEPLPNKRRLRDLATAIAPPDEQLFRSLTVSNVMAGGSMGSKRS
jgi:succinate dehydrogenase/fumarate reductase-like Fe-S protein